MNILMSSRGVRVSDVLSREDINEIADTEAGVVGKALGTSRIEKEKEKAKAKAKALEQKKKETPPLVAETAVAGEKADFAEEAKIPAEKVIEEVAGKEEEKPVKLRDASVGKDAKATLEESKDLNQFVR